MFSETVPSVSSRATTDTRRATVDASMETVDGDGN
jgi:hypothetical protein